MKPKGLVLESFFFSSRRRHTRFDCDWSSDVCSSDLAQGKEAAGPESSGGKYDSRKYKFAERIDYAEMREFVVFIDGPLGTNAPGPTQSVQVVTTRKISQKSAMFSPHVLPVMAGTTEI